MSCALRVALLELAFFCTVALNAHEINNIKIYFLTKKT